MSIDARTIKAAAALSVVQAALIGRGVLACVMTVLTLMLIGSLSGIGMMWLLGAVSSAVVNLMLMVGLVRISQQGLAGARISLMVAGCLAVAVALDVYGASLVNDIRPFGGRRALERYRWVTLCAQGLSAIALLGVLALVRAIGQSTGAVAVTTASARLSVMALVVFGVALVLRGLMAERVVRGGLALALTLGVAIAALVLLVRIASAVGQAATALQFGPPD